MTLDERPPGWLTRLLLRRYPAGPARASLLGDLHEEYNAFRPRVLRRPWFALVTLRLLLSRPSSESGGTSPWRLLVFDFSQAWRALRAQPTYALTCILTLALGLGATLAVSTVVYGALLRPLPYPYADRIVRIGDRSLTSAPHSISSMSIPNYLDVARRSQLFDAFSAHRYTRTTLSSGDQPRRLVSIQVTPGFFTMFGTPPVVGRDFGDADVVAGAPGVAIISHSLWQQLGGDPTIVGRSLLFDLEPRTVVGVAPADFTFPADPQAWFPLVWDAAAAPRRQRSIEGLARLVPGAPLDAGVAELQTIFASLAAEYSDVSAEMTMAGVPLREWMVGHSRGQLTLFAGAAALVLLMVAVNVAGLFVARSEARGRDLAVRAALGASRFALIRHAVAESVLLSLAGGALGLIVAAWGAEVLAALYGSRLPRAEQIGINGDIVMFAAGLSVALGVLAGLIGAIQLSASRLQAALRGSGRTAPTTGRGARRVLVGAQVALGVVLLSGAALLLHSLWRLAQVDLGINTSGVLTFNVGLPAARYGSPEARLQFFDRLSETLAAAPGVRAAGVTSRLPLFGGSNGYVDVDGRPDVRPFEARPLVEMRVATNGYFDAIGARVVAGQIPTTAPHTVVVNQAFARELVGDGAQVVGVGVRMPGQPDRFEIAAVISDVREYGPERPAPPAIYWRLGEGPFAAVNTMTFVVRAEDEAINLAGLARARLAEVDPDLPMHEVASLNAVASRRLGEDRHSAFALLAVFGGVALVLGAIGLYGIVAYDVQQRTREIGVRLALGAQRSDVLALVLRDGLGLAAAGVAIGLVGAVASTRVLRNLLWNLSPGDPATLACVAAGLLIVAALACLLPARRAAAIAPVDALRHQ
jgi:predicted permease